MAITDIGTSIQIRILFEDGEELKAMRTRENEPWHEIIHRLIQENKKLRTVRKPEIQTVPISLDAPIK